MSKPEPAVAAPPKVKAAIGDMVHFFDEARAGPFARPGVGPYAAIVTAFDQGGVSLEVVGPLGGRFNVGGVRHKTDLDPADKGRRKWWQHRHETK